MSETETKEPPKQLPEHSQYEAEFRLHGFDIKPAELKAEFDRRVVGQDAAKITLSTAICTHYKKIQLEEVKMLRDDPSPKPRVLLMGPSGSGKTTLMKEASRLIGMPCVRADATRYTSSGYVGKDVDEIIQTLFKESGNSIPVTELGMIFVDEIDKKARDESSGRDIAGASVQQEFLKILEGDEVDITGPHQGKKGVDIKVKTQNMFVVLAGAFEGLDWKSKAGIGFGYTAPEEISTSPLYGALTRFGFMPQFFGRVPYIGMLEELTEEQMCEILTLQDGDLRKGVLRDFSAYGITLNLRDDGVAAIAAKAKSEGMGARVLMHELTSRLGGFLYALPSTDVTELDLTPELINDPQGTLDTLLQKYPMKIKPLEEADPHKRGFYHVVEDELNRLDIATYMKELQGHGVPKRFRRAAATYGIDKRLIPRNMPDIIEDFKSQINDYVHEFQSRWAKTLTIKKDAATRLITQAFYNRTDVTLTIDTMIGRYIDDDEVMRQTNAQVVVIDAHALKNPDKYAHELRQYHGDTFSITRR